MKHLSAAIGDYEKSLSFARQLGNQLVATGIEKAIVECKEKLETEGEAENATSDGGVFDSVFQCAQRSAEGDSGDYGDDFDEAGSDNASGTQPVEES